MCCIKIRNKSAKNLKLRKFIIMYIWFNWIAEVHIWVWMSKGFQPHKVCLSGFGLQFFLLPTIFGLRLKWVLSFYGNDLFTSVFLLFPLKVALLVSLDWLVSLVPTLVLVFSIYTLWKPSTPHGNWRDKSEGGATTIMYTFF